MVLWVLAVLFGFVQSAQAVWDFADAANGLIAIPNLLFCGGGIVAETKAYKRGLAGQA